MRAISRALEIVLATILSFDDRNDERSNNQPNNNNVAVPQNQIIC